MQHRLLLLLLFYLWCLSAAETTNRRIVVTLTSYNACEVAETVFHSSNCASVAKCYGRRMVLNVEKCDFEDVEASLRSHIQKKAEVATVEEDSVFSLTSTGPDPPLLPTTTTTTVYAGSNTVAVQENSSNTLLATQSNQWNLDLLHVWDLWQEYSTYGEEKTVAVLDSGLAEPALPAFQNRVKGGYDFVSDPDISKDGDGRDANFYDPGDADASQLSCNHNSWHGTRVGSVLAANYSGSFFGVAPAANIVPVRVLGKCGMGYASDVADAIVWAAGGQINGMDSTAAVDIMIMAFAGRGKCPSFMQTAVDLALQNNVALYAAAGNEPYTNSSAHFPANCIGVISVGALNARNEPAWYSSKNAILQMPGGDSENPVPCLDGHLNVALCIGTSIAVPHAGGLAALSNARQLIPRTVNQTTTASWITFYNSSSSSMVQSAQSVNLDSAGGTGSVSLSSYGASTGGWPNTRYYGVGFTASILTPATFNFCINSVGSGTDAVDFFIYGCSYNFQAQCTQSWSCCGSISCGSSSGMSASFQMVSYWERGGRHGTGSVSWTVTGCATGYSLVGSQCARCCGAGKYNSVLGSSTCATCGSNTYSDACGASCISCPTYYVSPAGSSSVSACVLACPAGVYASGTTCVSCAAGTYSTTANATNSSVCQDCSAGQYSPAGSTACTNCPAGRYSAADRSGQCTLCPGGTYSGTVGANTSLTCQSCMQGEFSLAGSSVCTDCPAGSYNSFESSSSCTLCPAGTYSDDIASNTSDSCLTCPAATYSLAGSGQCTICPRGTYNGLERQGACAQCPGGTYSKEIGALNDTVCEICSAGTISSAAGSATCTTCGAGTYSYEGSTSCTQCPAGKASSATKATDPSTCMICPAGTIASAAGSETCTTCGAGTYSYEGNTSCTQCPAGTASSATRATDPSTCVICPIGTYSTAGSSACTVCAAGRFSNVIGATSIATCLTCPAGTYSLANSSACTPCPAGTISSSAGSGSCTTCGTGRYSFEGNTSCTLCPAGTASAGTGAVNASTCAICPAGTISSAAGSATCTTCGTGTYSFEGNTSCTSCPAGTASSATRAINASTCAICPVGTYSLAQASTCTQCAAGRYSNVTGATSSATCLQCPAGSYSLAGSFMCTLCSAGTYSATLGATSSANCLTCGTGTYSFEGNTSCTQCPAGTASSATRATNASTCVTCLAGTIAATAGSATCASCLAGSYSLTNGSTSCTQCAAGTASATVGASDASTCLTCGAGNYSGAGAALCTQCPQGTYSGLLGATNVANCTKCVAGTYSTALGANSVATCVQCGADTYSTAVGATSSATCVSCGNGLYSEVGSTGCLTCAGGTFACKTRQVSQSMTVTDTGNGWANKHTCAVLTTGDLKCWGQNDWAQLGYDDYTDKITPPSSAVNIGSGVSAKQVATGEYHTCVLTTTGGIKCWGMNIVGQLGYADTTHRSSPPVAFVNLGTGVTASQISVGYSHGCAVTSTSQLKCWGSNSAGQLGYGDTATKKSPPAAYVNLGTGVTVAQVSCGGFHTCALTTLGKVLCWGDASSGQTGYADTATRTVPGPEVNLGTGLTAKQISAGYYHTCVILSNDKVKCWGINNNGQLGYNDYNARTSPPSATLSGTPYSSPVVVQVQAGFSHTCWLLDTGEMQCWGASDSGQIGYGSTTQKPSPNGIVDVGAGLKVSRISLGRAYTCVILSDGGLKCFGYNTGGQLGLGSTAAIGDNANEIGDSLPRVNLGTYIATITCTASSSNTGCQPCPEGTYSGQGSSACTNCTAGTYSYASSSVCTSCLAGKFSTAVRATDASTCASCPRGTYSPTSGSTVCTNCTIGTYSDLLASTSNATCVKCPAGTYSTLAGASTCLTCPGGSYSSASGSTTCATCKSGTASSLY